MIKTYKHLCDLYPFYKHHIISLIGGGGKTSLLFSLGQDVLAYHTHVCLSTTTHMMYPKEIAEENILLHANEEQLKMMLHTYDITFVASLYNQQKLQKPSASLFPIMEKEADIVLYEADGSKRLPIKYMGTYEPALPDTTQLCVQVVGYSCLHQPLASVCHRYALACSHWGWKPTDILDIQKLIQLISYNFSRVQTKEKLLLINQIDRSITSDDINAIQQHILDLPILFVSLQNKTYYANE